MAKGTTRRVRPALALLSALAVAGSLEATIVVRAPSGLAAETAALILSGQQGGDLAIEAIAAPLAWTGESVTVGVFVEVAGLDLLFDQEDELLRVEFLAYAIAGQTRVADYLIQAFELDVEEYGEILAAGGMRFSGKLELPPGDYSVAVMVRSPKQAVQGLGLRRIELAIPAVDAADAILQPRLASSDDGWVNVFQVLPGEGQPGLSRAELRQASLDAAAKPVLAPREGVAVVVEAFGEGAASRAYSLEFSRPDGEVVDQRELAVARDAEPSAPAGPIRVGGSIDLSGMPSGEYLLRVTAERADGEPVVSPALPIIVAEVAAEQTWATASQESRSLPVEPEDTPRIPASKRRTKINAGEVRELAKRYASILETGSGDRHATAGRGLAEFEQDAVARFADRGVPSLVAAEMDLIRDLGKKSPQALIPVARLHHEAYRVHRANHAFLLATHARSLALAVIDLYIEGGTVEESERRMALRSKEERLAVASRLLATFGGDLQQAGLRRFGERLFHRALECDQTNEAALMGLGASFEKYSEYAEAVNYFDRLVAAWPESGEGRLRLAINLVRLGREAKAVKHFEVLIDGEFDAWVQKLAFQELARIHFGKPDLEAAGRVLAQAGERFPDEPKFYLQRAFLRAATGEPWRVQDELRRLDALEAQGGDSPRYVYSQWPVDALTRIWQLSEADVASRRGALAAALAGAAGERPS